MFENSYIIDNEPKTNYVYKFMQVASGDKIDYEKIEVDPNMLLKGGNSEWDCNENITLAPASRSFSTQATLPCIAANISGVWKIHKTQWMKGKRI